MNQITAPTIQFKKKAGYLGPTNYMGEKVSPMNHPTAIANIILNTIQHQGFFGVQILAPPGFGKSTLASVIGHHIHESNPNYDVVWAGAYEFTHQEQFFKGLTKKPHVVILDDITGALKQLSGKQIEAQFEALTKVRWILDPEHGKIPIVIITTSHYSKNTEKQIRAQFGMTIFCGFGIEEKSNIDTFAEKGTLPYNVLNAYGAISDSMFEQHQFSLRVGKEKITYQTDKPFRCSCMISYSKASMILFSDKDVCEKCVKKKYRKFLDPHLVFERIKTFMPNLRFNKTWEIALEYALVKHGVPEVLEPKSAAILDWIDHDLATTFDTDWVKVKNIYWTEHKKKAPPKKVYHRRKRSEQVLAELEPLAVRIPYSESKPVEIDNEDPFGEDVEMDKEFLSEQEEEI